MISNGFNMISGYLGGWATWFLASMLFIAMFRIGFAFVMKIFRLNIDYRAPINKNDFNEKHAKHDKKK